MKRTIAEQLKEAATAEELEGVLTELATSALGRRWRKSQVLHYVRPALRRVVDRFFVGETWRELTPLRSEAQEAPVGPPLEEALRDFAGWSGGGLHEDAADPDTAAPVAPRDDGQGLHPHADERLRQMVEALGEEIREVSRARPRRFRLSNGKCIGHRRHEFVYEFHWSSEPDPHVPGTLLLPPDRKYAARVGDGLDGKRRYELVVERYVGPTIETATFEVDPTYLLKCLRDKLIAGQDLIFQAPSLAEGLFRRSTGPGPKPSVRDPDLGEDQQRALAMVRDLPVGLVWGPPGTGKTRTLGAAIRDLAAAGRRILLVSPFNIAVDQATISGFERSGRDASRIVRVGRVGKALHQLGLSLEAKLELEAERSGLASHARALATAATKRVGISGLPLRRVRGCLEAIGACAVRMRDSHDPEADRIEEVLKQLQRAFRAPEQQIIRSSRVVCTTVTLALHSALLSKERFDHILVDESSVLRTPEAVLLSALGATHISFFGDPKQLRPIVEASTPQCELWLKRTPFDLLQVGQPTTASGQCAFLRVQRRMAPPIRHVVSALAYQGQLQDGAGVPSGSVFVVDTSATPAHASTRWIGLRASRENVVHRDVVGRMVQDLRAGAEREILVLSPFRAQKQAYKEEPRTAALPYVRYSTVHASQGTEQRIVILDLVIAPGRGKSRFLDDSRNPELANLLTVALSRAQQALFVVAHRTHIEQSYPSSLLTRLLDTSASVGPTLSVPADLRFGEMFRSLT